MIQMCLSAFQIPMAFKKSAAAMPIGMRWRHCTISDQRIKNPKKVSLFKCTVPQFCADSCWHHCHHCCCYSCRQQHQHHHCCTHFMARGRLFCGGWDQTGMCQSIAYSLSAQTVKNALGGVLSFGSSFFGSAKEISKEAFSVVKEREGGFFFWKRKG